MKKAEIYLEQISCYTIGEDADLDDINNFYYSHKDLVNLIKQIQIDTIEETVKLCVKEAKTEDYYVKDHAIVPIVGIRVNKDSILNCAEILKKELE